MECEQSNYNETTICYITQHYEETEIEVKVEVEEGEVVVKDETELYCNTSEEASSSQVTAYQYVVSQSFQSDEQILCLQTGDNDVHPSFGQPVAIPVSLESDSDVHCKLSPSSTGLRTVTYDSADTLELHSQPQQMVIETSNDDGDAYLVQQVTVQNTETVDSTPIWRRPAQTKISKSIDHTSNSWLTTKQLKNSGRAMMVTSRCRVLLDMVKSIPVSEFKDQLANTSDIVVKPESAPSTKQYMKFLMTGGVGKLFAVPGRALRTRRLFQLYERHLTSKPQEDEPAKGEPLELQPLGFQPQVDPSKVKRITRKRRYPEAEEYNRRQWVESLQNEDHSNLHILVQAAENDTMAHENLRKVYRVYPAPRTKEDTPTTSIDLVDGEDGGIIVIETVDNQQVAESGLQQNIEVLLAAAESESDMNNKGINSVMTVDGRTILPFEQVIYCQQNEDGEHIIYVEEPTQA